MWRNNFQTLSKPYYKTRSCHLTRHSIFFSSLTLSSRSPLLEKQLWRRRVLGVPKAGLGVSRPGGAEGAAAQCLSGSRSDTGGDSGSGAWDRPGAHWLGGSRWPHKGLIKAPVRWSIRPSHPRPAMPSPPPALPWLLAACCLCALPRGSGTSRSGERESPGKVGSCRGAWLGSAASITAVSRPAGFPQPFSRHRDGVELPPNQVRPALPSESHAGGQVGRRRERWETRLVRGMR